jgi:hypothetical protein
MKLSSWTSSVFLIAICGCSYLPFSSSQNPAPKPSDSPTTIDLSGKRLTSLPEFLWRQPGIKELNLRKNKLTDLPENFSALDQLEILNLSKNKFKAFPKALLKLQNLKELSLSGNKIYALPDEIRALQQLEKLDLFDTWIENLPIESLVQLPNLKEIDLRQTMLYDHKAVDLKKALPNVKIRTMPGCDCNAQKKRRRE